MQDKLKELQSIRDGDLSIGKARVLGIVVTSIQKKYFPLRNKVK